MWRRCGKHLCRIALPAIRILHVEWLHSQAYYEAHPFVILIEVSLKLIKARQQAGFCTCKPTRRSASHHCTSGVGPLEQISWCFRFSWLRANIDDEVSWRHVVLSLSLYSSQIERRDHLLLSLMEVFCQISPFSTTHFFAISPELNIFAWKRYIKEELLREPMEWQFRYQKAPKRAKVRKRALKRM